MSYILVPLDGSELANRAIPLAVSLAKATGSKLKLVQAAVSPATLDVGMAVEMIVEAARQEVANKRDEIKRDYGLEVDTRSALAFPDRLILDEATVPDAGAIVMSTHGRTGLLRLARGSVAESVLRQSPIPVYLVPSSAGVQPEQPTIRHILVPLDGSDLAYAVTAPVMELAPRFGAEVTLFRVFDNDVDQKHNSRHALFESITGAPDYFGPIKERLGGKGVVVNSKTALGVPATHILKAAEHLDVDLIALATHGRSGLSRMRYGSVAEGVLRHSSRPVMTFGPEAIRRLAGTVSVNEAELPRPALV